MSLKLKPDDTPTSTNPAESLEQKIDDLEKRVVYIERFMMRVLDHFELDHPTLGWDER